jgi:hypothetical protein
MRLILSRKGFDSKYGGCPSPILPDGTMFSLPITSNSGPHRLGQLNRGDLNFGDITRDLTQDRRKPSKQWGRGTGVHLDPDLDAPVLGERAAGWTPSYGTVPPALTHLRNEHVRENDIFLFFGWFRSVEQTSRGWQYVGAAPHMHVIFGWLQVGEVIDVGADGGETVARHPWLRGHPHIERSSYYGENNVIYSARSSVSVNGRDCGVPGGGVFGRFDPRLRLTREGQTRSHWQLPGWFLPESDLPTLSHHHKRSRWRRQGEHVHLHTVAIGQEFVLDCEHYADAAAWIRSLLKCAS